MFHIETHYLLFLTDYFYLKQPGARLPGLVCFYMVERVRLELTTFRLKAGYSTIELPIQVALPFTTKLLVGFLVCTTATAL